MEEIAVSKEMWSDWKAHPVTKEFFRRLWVKREGMKEELSDGAGREAIDNYIGQCQAYKDAINYGLHEFECIDSEKEESVDD